MQQEVSVYHKQFYSKVETESRGMVHILRVYTILSEGPRLVPVT